MAITSTDFLKDTARIHYWCKRPWGTPDEYAVVEVPYESIRALPHPPSLDHGQGGDREAWEESVFIPLHNLTVSLHFTQWEETDDFRMQAFLGGPYLGTLTRSESTLQAGPGS
jgi:hypothetical protein